MDDHKNKQERGPMPDDYMPQKTMEFMPVDFDLIRGFSMLDDEQAGKLVKRMLTYAQDYSKSYDVGLSMDMAGLSDVACFVADMAIGKIQRRADVYRLTSWGRAGNKGGRPPKKP